MFVVEGGLHEDMYIGRGVFCGVDEESRSSPGAGSPESPSSPGAGSPKKAVRERTVAFSVTENAIVRSRTVFFGLHRVASNRRAIFRENCLEGSSDHW